MKRLLIWQQLARALTCIRLISRMTSIIFNCKQDHKQSSSRPLKHPSGGGGILNDEGSGFQTFTTCRGMTGASGCAGGSKSSWVCFSFGITGVVIALFFICSGEFCRAIKPGWLPGLLQTQSICQLRYPVRSAYPAGKGPIIRSLNSPFHHFPNLMFRNCRF